MMNGMRPMGTDAGARRRWRPWRLLFLLALVLVWQTPIAQAAEEAALWRALLSGNHFVLLRHAIAPGTGDPADFSVDRCDTQRNLSDEGRSQARKIGDRFRENGIEKALIFSSQWCRCLETARLLGLGTVAELPALNSFFRQNERRDMQTRELRNWLSGQDLGQPLVLVTHQVNITAFTGVYPASGELVIVHRSDTGETTVKGTIQINSPSPPI